jgi:hypothetical protein
MVRYEPKGKERTKIFRRAPLLYGDEADHCLSWRACVQAFQRSLFSLNIYILIISGRLITPGYMNCQAILAKSPMAAKTGVPDRRSGTPLRAFSGIYSVHSPPVAASAPTILDRGINRFSSPL